MLVYKEEVDYSEEPLIPKQHVKVIPLHWRQSRKLFQRVIEERFPSAGDHGAGDDCLQHSGVADVVGREESPQVVDPNFMPERV